ncbi:zinc finger MYM-type protein 1-like [Rhopalosiphum padi]|uniref:zinc finger MYM-type protein 1-like n=1 Tax=Rhopalosiphum padi TaxID=40932 RepID=UPI00298D833E|nr:zinc finger MYM-type protein 1-like [Rhopalosiphum padi]
MSSTQMPSNKKEGPQGPKITAFFSKKMKSSTKVLQTETEDIQELNVEECYDKYDSNLHPDDPKISIPKNQIEFKQRVLKGPYQPVLKIFPRTTFGNANKQRSFQHSWYNLFPWLEYSPKADLAFCFPCRMFNGATGLNAGQSEIVYSKTGFKNWKLATIRFNVHQKTKVHLNSSSALSNFLDSKSIDVVLDKTCEHINSQKEIQRLKNREIVKRIIDIILCISIGGKPLRGHTEKTNDVHKGLFLDIVSLLSKYDSLFNEHFISGPKNCLYTSNRIQNDLISSINLVIRKQLQDIITDRKISLIADETSDIGHHEQLSIVLRYFDETKNCPIEQFLCLKRMTSVDAQSIFDKMSDVVQEYGIKWENVVSICFDGASTMSGSTGGVQAKFKEKNNNSFFVHCYGHCLNLVLVDSIGRHNIVTFDFFGNIQLIYNFIEGSCTRHAVLEKIANFTNTKLKTLKSISTARWACRSEAISAIKENYPSILAAIEEIVDNTKQSDVRAKGKGILHQMKTFEFIFAMLMLDPILSSILKTSAFLQSSDINLLTALEIIEKVSTKIDYSSSTQYYMSSKEEEMKVSVYYSTLDHIISGINIRFNQETINMIRSIGNLLILNINSIDITVLSAAFDLNSDMLKTEINLLKHTENIPKGEKNKCGDWINWLTQSNYGRETIFCNVFKALKTFMVIPVTSCSCERSFSKLSIVKTKLRSTMRQDRLNSLLTIFIEQELASGINIDDVIDTFKNLTPVDRRMEL